MKERNIALCIFLSIITCGIYALYWYACMTNDAVKANNGKEYNTSGGMMILYYLITCGIYGIYWYYKMGKALYSAKQDKGMNSSDNSILYLILGILGFGIISNCLIQSELNQLAK